jgi:hypothetical protein
MRHKAKIVAHDERWNRVTVEIPNAIDPANPHRVEVWKVDYDKWLAGAYVQDAFPDLDRGTREIFVTGIGPDNWPTVIGDPGDRDVWREPSEGP